MSQFIDLSAGDFFEFYSFKHIVSFTGSFKEGRERPKLVTSDGQTYYLNQEDAQWLAKVLRTRSYKRTNNGTQNS